MVGFLTRFLLKKAFCSLNLFLNMLMLKNRKLRIEFLFKSIWKYFSDLNTIYVIELRSFHSNIEWAGKKPCVLQNLEPGPLLATCFNLKCSHLSSTRLPPDLHNHCWLPYMTSVPPMFYQQCLLAYYRKLSSRLQESKERRLAMNLENDIHIKDCFSL